MRRKCAGSNVQTLKLEELAAAGVQYRALQNNIRATVFANAAGRGASCPVRFLRGIHLILPEAPACQHRSLCR